MKRIFLLIITFTSAFTFIFATSTKAASINIPDKIRVVIADNAKELNLSIRGKYRIATIETGQLLKEGRTFFNIKIRPVKNGIDFGKDILNIHAIEIIPEREPAIYLGKRLYRGSLQILRTKEGLLRAINIINLQDYLKGVLYHEVSHRWPMEAMKAQAIASRTFALYQAQQNKNKYYYLKSDVSSQVYGGVYAEKYRTNRAVEETRGKVLIYRGKLLPAFFHATCGGKTEDAARLWKVRIGPLKGIDCFYCENSPHYNWQSSISLEDAEKALRSAGYKISDIDSIKIIDRDRSARVTKLRLSSKRIRKNISAKDFRHILGSRLIRSTNFTVAIKGGKAYFNGRGWGHGVGMCQWGAFSMAKKRKTAADILANYYPGAHIADIAGDRQY